MVKIFTRSIYKINRKRIINQVTSYLKKVGFDEDCLINIIFLGKRKMKQIAKKYKKENLALPVLSFSYLNDSLKPNRAVFFPEKERLIGEVFICYPQAVLIAAKRERKVDSIISELIKHGLDNIIT